MKKIRIFPTVVVILEVLYTAIYFIAENLDYSLSLHNITFILYNIIFYGWEIVLLLGVVNAVLLLLLIFKYQKQNKSNNFEIALFTVNFFMIIAVFLSFIFYDMP